MSIHVIQNTHSHTLNVLYLKTYQMHSHTFVNELNINTKTMPVRGPLHQVDDEHETEDRISFIIPERRYINYQFPSTPFGPTSIDCLNIRPAYYILAIFTLIKGAVKCRLHIFPLIM